MSCERNLCQFVTHADYAENRGFLAIMRRHTAQVATSGGKAGISVGAIESYAITTMGQDKGLFEAIATQYTSQGLSQADRLFPFFLVCLLRTCLLVSFLVSRSP